MCCKVSFKVPLPVKLTTLRCCEAPQGCELLNGSWHSQQKVWCHSIHLGPCMLSRCNICHKTIDFKCKVYFYFGFCIYLKCRQLLLWLKTEIFDKWGSVLYDEECRPHVKQAINSFPNWRKEDGAEWVLVLLPSSGSRSSVPIGNVYVFHSFFFCVCRSWDFISW